MSTVTLTESAKLALNMLITGVIETVITVDKFFQVLPFNGINGNAVQYTRENVLGAVAAVGVASGDNAIGAGVSGDNSTERAAAKDPATFTSVTSSLTTIMGDAEVNGMLQATRSSDGNDQTKVQIASKAKSAGRKYRNYLINGTGTDFSFPGLIALCASAQTVDNGTDGAVLAFEDLDELLDLVTDKDGQVDYIVLHAKPLRKYMGLLRALGGASIGEVVTLPGGDEVPAYRGVPMFRNDWIPINQTKGAQSGTATTIFAGTFDDGSMQHGISGLTASTNAGMSVVDVGESETKDERIWRVKWYCGLALFSEKGLAQITGVNVA